MQPIKRLSSRSIWLLGLAVSLVACAVRLPELQALPQVGEVQVVSAQQAIGTPTPLIDPFESGLQGPTSTPTPNVLTPQTPQYIDTSTPIPITIVFNDAEGLPDSEIWAFVVRRADGRHEKYLLPIEDVPRDSNEHYKEFYDNLLQMGPSDVITFEGPLNYRRGIPFDPTQQATPSATPARFPDAQGTVTPEAQVQASQQPTQILSLPFVPNNSEDE
jgi:hypothetical protein